MPNVTSFWKLHRIHPPIFLNYSACNRQKPTHFCHPNKVETLGEKIELTIFLLGKLRLTYLGYQATFINILCGIIIFLEDFRNTMTLKMPTQKRLHAKKPIFPTLIHFDPRRS